MVRGAEAEIPTPFHVGPPVLSEAEIQAKVFEIIAENSRRNDIIHATFNPITGEGSICMKDRVRIYLPELTYAWYIPSEMMRIPLIKEVLKHGSIRSFVEAEVEAGNMDVDLGDPEDVDDAIQEVSDQICRLRSRYDFAFWAAFYVYIKPKGGGEDVLFRLSRPQRRLVERLEANLSVWSF